MVTQGEDCVTNSCQLTSKTDHCLNVVEDFLSLTLQENEKENILPLGDILFLALKDKLLPQDFASNEPWDGIDEVIQDLKDIFLWERMRKELIQTWPATN